MEPRTTIDIAKWVVDEGLSGTLEVDLLSGFCERLVEAGIPLMRTMIAQPTLHPVVAARGFQWRRNGNGTVQEDWERTVAEAGEEYMQSPFRHMLETGSTRLRLRLERGNQPLEFPLLENFRAEGGTDYLGMMTEFGEADQLGSVKGLLSSWTSDGPSGFSDDDIIAIEQLLPVLALVFKGASTYRTAHSVAETYLGAEAGRRVLHGEIERGSFETIDAVLWYCDLQGFTKVSETTPIGDIIEMLNEYFECMVEPIHAHGGEVLKFMGDGLFAIFKLDHTVNVCRGALDAADEALARVVELNRTREAAGQPVTEFSLALHLGNVMYGNIGSRDRLDFTVVGPAVNEVSRIEAMCSSLDRNMVISSAFYEAADECQGRLVSLGRYALRGVRQPQELFTLLSPDDLAPERE